MEHDIPFGNSNRENGTTFLDFPLFLGIFQWEEPTKRVPFTAEPEIPEILTKWKAPSDNQIPSSPGRQRCQMPGVCRGGGGHVEASIWPIHNLQRFSFFCGEVSLFANSRPREFFA